MKRIETPSGWRYLADDGRISVAYAKDEPKNWSTNPKGEIQTDCVEWLSGAAAIVAGLEWYYADENPDGGRYDSWSESGKAVIAIAQAELDREKSK